MEEHRISSGKLSAAPSVNMASESLMTLSEERADNPDGRDDKSTQTPSVIADEHESKVQHPRDSFPRWKWRAMMALIFLMASAYGKMIPPPLFSLQLHLVVRVVENKSDVD